MNSKTKSLISLIAVISVISISTQAEAYLNPGTGSMLLQALIAGLAVLTVTIRMYWYKLVALIKGEKYDPEEDLLADLDFDDDDSKE